MKNIYKEIENLADEAYEQIDQSLDCNDYEQIELGVAKGLDLILKIKRIIKELE